MLTDRYFICERFLETYRPIRERYGQLLEARENCEDGYRYLQWFRQSGEKSVYRGHMLDEKRLFRFGRTRLLCTYWLHLLSLGFIREIKLRRAARNDPGLYYNFQLYKGLPSIVLYRNLLRNARKAALKLSSLFWDGPLPPKYAFLTLHLQPEASTSVLSPFFVNQDAVIDVISRALPLDWCLVVKPNPSMIGVEPMSFYRKIRSIPNVFLVSSKANTQKLIKKSKAVVAVTGTSGFEGALHGKKVIVLSDKTIWSMIKGVSLCTDYRKLHSLFKEAESYQADDYSLAAYLQAVHEQTFSLEKKYIWEGPYDLLDSGYREAMALLTKALVTKLSKCCHTA